MSVILAIDAAWTEHNPSGVAVVKSVGNVWQCIGPFVNHNNMPVHFFCQPSAYQPKQILRTPDNTPDNTLQRNAKLCYFLAL
jgi:hypothetical protein